MEETYEVEIVTELDEVEVFRVTAASPADAEQFVTEMVERGDTHLCGCEVICATAL